MTLELFIKVLMATVETGTPILFATLGSIITERSGILNLGVEGMMIVAAFIGFFVALVTGSPWFAVLCAGLASSCMGALHGTVCLVFRGSQVVSGLALTILGVGLADYLGMPYISNPIPGFSPMAWEFPSFIEGWLEGSAALPVIKALFALFFNRTALEYLSLLAIPACWFFLMRTRFGLAVRAAGENPQAVAAAGLSPYRMRWLGILLGGFLIGVGGAYFSLVLNHGWTQNITAGRGWIAIALVIFSFWRPGRAVLGAYLFCGVEAFQGRLQSSGVFVLSSWLLHMFPYVLTLFVLFMSSFRGKGRKAPAALGVNLEPGD